MKDKELTYEEALERLLISCEQAWSEFGNLNDSDVTYKGYIIFKRDYNAIKKLEEIVEKATPKKPITIKPEGTSIFDYPTNRIKCPACGVQLPMKKNCLKKKVPITYCDRCGQKLDWSDVNE